ncbi:MAG: radical SAM protein [Deltaproteobacteria bacterium]|nr:radical SAM protein [Deltaproteobacteria bacterium]
MGLSFKDELHYQYRCLRLGLGFLTKRYIHCNLQVTYRCNFKCEICDFWKTEHKALDELSLKEIKIIGDKLNKLGTLIVSLAGGEPLIRQDLFDVITILNRANHLPILITNGWFVNETVAKDILRAGLQEISVSVDYCSPEKHDHMRGMPGSWQKAVNALELLNRYRPDRRNRVHMISVLMDDNLEEVEGMIRLAKDIGVTYMLSLYSFNRGAKAQRLPKGEVTQYLLNLKKKYPEFVTLSHYILKLDQALSSGGIGHCRTGELLLNIDNRGNVARCTEMLDRPVGNILTDDIFEIAGRLKKAKEQSDCAACWTSCRGFAESLFEPPRLKHLREFLHSVKPYGVIKNG